MAGQHSQTPEFIFLGLYSGEQEKSYSCIYNRVTREYSIFRTMASHPSNPMNLVPQLSVNNYTISIIPAHHIMDVKNYLAYMKEKISKQDLKFTPPRNYLTASTKTAIRFSHFTPFDPKK